MRTIDLLVFWKFSNVCKYHIRGVFKKYREFCVFLNYLFIHENLFFSLQSNHHQILYTCAKVFFQSSKHFKKSFLWSGSAPSSIPSLSTQAISWASSVSKTRKSHRGPDLGNTVAVILVRVSRRPVSIPNHW